jgi:hypothetical protein
MDSVNPVNEGVFAPADVDEFNRIIKEGLDAQILFIDTGEKLREKGFSTTDTLHYTEESSKLLYELLVGELGDLQTE